VRYLTITFSRPYRYFPCLVAALVVAISLAACAPTRQEHTENRYSSATWSPGGDQVAYFRTYVEYTSIKPRISIFVGEDTEQDIYQVAHIFLCVNNASGTSEHVLDEIKAPTAEEGAAAYTNIEWADDHILYGAGIRDSFATGVLQITTEGINKQQIEPGYDAIGTLSPRLLNANGQELYCGYGDYGFFGYQTIYLFDHSLHQVRVYLHDPLSTQEPFVPPYSVTQQ
jgi:hypothetical protein